MSGRPRFSRILLGAGILAGLFFGLTALRTKLGGPEVALPVHGTVADFAFESQTGRRITRDDLFGHVWIADFIFTRCAGPCPRMTADLARIAGDLSAFPELRLVSFSVDPEYDTPGILKEYAIQRAIDTSNYSFLTGPQMAIKSLLQQFGILTEMQGDLLNHTAATLLLDETGRIIHRADGSEWDVKDFVGRMKKS